MFYSILPVIALALPQADVQDVRPSASVETSTEFSVSVGASYRPTGESEALQREVAQQLSTGWGAATLAYVSDDKVRVNVQDDGNIGLQYRLIAVAQVDPQSFLDGNAEAMARSMLIDDHALAERVDEVAGWQAAVAVRAALLVTDTAIPMDVDGFANYAALMAQDPEVRATATMLVATGADLSTVLVAAADHQSRVAVESVHDAASELGGKLRDQSSQDAARIEGAALAAWSKVTANRPEVQRRIRRVSDEARARSALAAAGATGKSRELMQSGAARSAAAAAVARERGALLASMWGERSAQQVVAARQRSAGVAEAARTAAQQATRQTMQATVTAGTNAWSNGAASASSAMNAAAGGGRALAADAQRASAERVRQLQVDASQRAAVASAEAARQLQAARQQAAERAQQAATSIRAGAGNALNGLRGKLRIP